MPIMRKRVNAAAKDFQFKRETAKLDAARLNIARQEYARYSSEANSLLVGKALAIKHESSHASQLARENLNQAIAERKNPIRALGGKVISSAEVIKEHRKSSKLPLGTKLRRIKTWMILKVNNHTSFSLYM